MELRGMTIEDYPQVHALWTACAGMGLNNLDDSRDGIDRFLKRNPETCFVAEEDGAVVGCILAGHDGRRGYIYHAAVRPDCRGRGFGRALAERAVQALGACGIHKVALVVFRRNEPGNAFWDKAGFAEREDLVYRNRALAEFIRTDT